MVNTPLAYKLTMFLERLVVYLNSQQPDGSSPNSLLNPMLPILTGTRVLLADIRQHRQFVVQARR